MRKRLRKKLICKFWDKVWQQDKPFFDLIEKEYKDLVIKEQQLKRLEAYKMIKDPRSDETKFHNCESIILNLSQDPNRTLTTEEECTMIVNYGLDWEKELGLTREYIR